MKLARIVRKTDELGRIVLPKEIRRTLNINTNDLIEILVDDDGQIILRKYKPACVLCNSNDRVITFNGCKVCHRCIKQIAGLAE